VLVYYKADIINSSNVTCSRHDIAEIIKSINLLNLTVVLQIRVVTILTRRVPLVEAGTANSHGAPEFTPRLLVGFALLDLLFSV
jgi:hypothetical protein